MGTKRTKQHFVDHVRRNQNTEASLEAVRVWDPQRVTFAFIGFLAKQDAKRLFESLCSSTHLYGRRLVLKWAEDEGSVDALRKKTAEHFYSSPKTSKKEKDFLDDLMDIEMQE